MFENAGKKLQSIAVTVFVINVIAFIILAIAFGWTKESYSWRYGTYTGTSTETVFNPGPFFGFLIGGIFGSYVECLALYAFGELVENSVQTERLIREYVKSTNRRDDQSVNTSNYSVVSRNASTEQKTATSIPTPPRRLFKTCPKCGYENSSDKIFCNNCGERI